MNGAASVAMEPSVLAGLSTELVLLLIEDDDLDARRIERLIDTSPRLQVSIERCRSMEEVPVVLARTAPDLALVDLTLPDASGTEMVRALVEHRPELPIIVQTAAVDEALPLEALGAGADDYLSKATLSGEVLERAICYSIARRSSRRRLQHAEVQLAEADADLDDITHVVAHDIRAPLRTARMMADRLIAMTESPDETTTELARRLDRSLGCLDDLVLGMLDYADLRGARLVAEPVPVADVAGDVRAALEADVIASDATLHVDVPDHLEVLLRTDLLHRVLQNLISNSIRYRRPDVPSEIHVEASARGGRVIIDVHDNGVGIPVEAHEKVFALFERLGSSGNYGLGLGLAVCRRIVANHGGSIGVVPTADHGTLMRIELPGAAGVVAINVGDDLQINDD